MRYLCFLLVTLTFSAVSGDVIKLKDGTQIEGQVMVEMDGVVIVATSGGRRKLNRGDIKEIVWSAPSETALPAAISSRPADSGFVILSPKTDSNHVSDNPEKPPSNETTVSGRAWSKEAKVEVTVKKGGKAVASAAAVVKAPEKPGEPATWHAKVRLCRGYNTIEARASAPKRKPASHSVRTFLDPILPAQAGKPYLNEDGTPQLDRKGKPIPNDIRGVVRLSFTARDPKEVTRYEIRIDGEVVSKKALYLWDTSKCFQEAHVITFVAEYRDGEVYHGSPRSYRSHRVRSRLVAGGTPPWRELDKRGRDLFKEGNVRKAFELITEAVVCGQKNVGRDHPDTAVSLCNLGTVCEAVEQYPEAEKCYKRAMDILEKKLGAKHRQVGGVLTMMARMYKSAGKPDEAQACEKRAKRILSP